MDQLHTPPRPSFSDSGEAEYLQFLNHLAWVRVEAGDSRSMSVVEFTAPKGFGPPLHRHNDEDELFIVTAGELSLRLGDEEIAAGSGSVTFLPYGVPHTFVVASDEASYINVTSVIGSRAPRFDRMVTELGEPIGHADLLAPKAIDPDLVASVCRAHGIDILGPPPGA